MLQTVDVVYTPKRLTTQEIVDKKLKIYRFLCAYNVKVGDLICPRDYSTDVQVVSVENKDDKIQNGITLKELRILAINEDVNIEKYLLTNKKENKMEKKSMFNSYIEKYKSQFIPEKDNLLKVSIDGNICVKIGEEYIGIDKDNNLISYPEEMCMDMPIYLQTKPYNQVQIGDIIKINSTYAKVLKKNANGSLSCLSFSGYTQSKKEIKDFMLGQSFVKVVVNIFSSMQTGGFNPVMLAMADGNIDMKDLMLMQMMQNGNTDQNSLLMMAMMDKDGDNSMFETMMMMQMMGGQVNFPFMPNQNNKE